MKGAVNSGQLFPRLKVLNHQWRHSLNLIQQVKDFSKLIRRAYSNKIVCSWLGQNMLIMARCLKIVINLFMGLKFTVYTNLTLIILVKVIFKLGSKE